MSIVNISPVAHFSANKNGSNQTISSGSYTALSFGTEAFDVGGYFNTTTAAWTPPAGRVILWGQFKATGTITAGGTVNVIAIYRDAVQVAGELWSAGALTGFMASTNLVGANIGPWQDVCNGANVYTMQAYVTCASGSATISGAVGDTFFGGRWIGTI